MTAASDELDVPAGSAPPVVEARCGDEDEGFHEIEDRARGPLIAPVMARAIVGTVFLMLVMVAFAAVLRSDAGFWDTSLSACLLLMLVTLQVFYFSRPGINMRSPLTYALLVVQACLAYLPMLHYGLSWSAMPLLLAGTVLLALPPVAAWAVLVAVVASVGWHEWGLVHDVEAVHDIVASLVVAFEVYGLTRLAGLIRDLHSARRELAKTAVAHERLRFAHDLHDLLGLRLSAIVPKGELAHRLVAGNPQRARQELCEILDVSRRALADVRAAARDYREFNLDEAARTTESMLASSRVEVRMDRNLGKLPVRVRALLASVLREGVANVLEFSDAERWDITIRQSGDRVSLDIVNDGVDESMVPTISQDSRWAAMVDRVRALDGELVGGLDGDGHFRLHVTVPWRSDLQGRTEEPGEQLPATKARLAYVFMAVVFVGIGTLSALRLAQVSDLRSDPFQYAVCVGYLLTLLVLQLAYISRPGVRLRQPTSYALLVVQACLVYLPALQFDVAWQPLPGLLAGSALLVLPPFAGWIGFGAVVASAGLLQAANGGDDYDIVFSAGSVVISGLVVYGLTWMVRSMTELRAARVQLAQAAVADERLRFARDLHDLLGLGLSAITLKSELAHRLVAVAPDKARVELTEIVAISRLALADVRLVADGYRELSLDEEVQAAQSLLMAGDVDVSLDVNCGELPTRVGTLLATVLREGVTNVVRHSNAERCEITVKQNERAVSLAIVNDGVSESYVETTAGSGIHNLSFRVALLGGELTAGLEPDGRFGLCARVPT